MEAVAMSYELFLEFLIILDYAVMYGYYCAVITVMGMGIFL